MTSLGKGFYGTVSSDTGFSHGTYEWKIKCLKLSTQSAVSVGVLTKSDFERSRKTSGNFWGKGRSVFHFNCQNGNGNLFEGHSSLFEEQTTIKSGKWQLEKGGFIKVRLECDKYLIHFWMGEEFLGKIDMKSVKKIRKNVKFYPGIMAFANFEADFKLVFD